MQTFATYCSERFRDLNNKKLNFKAAVCAPAKNTAGTEWEWPSQLFWLGIFSHAKLIIPVPVGTAIYCGSVDNCRAVV